MLGHNSSCYSLCNIKWSRRWKYTPKFYLSLMHFSQEPLSWSGEITALGKPVMVWVCIVHVTYFENEETLGGCHHRLNTEGKTHNQERTEFLASRGLTWTREHSCPQEESHSIKSPYYYCKHCSYSIYLPSAVQWWPLY